MKNFFVSGLLIIAIALVLAGCPDDYNTSGAGGKPDTPKGLVATPMSSTSIVISWPQVSGALQYYVYKSESYSNTYTQIGVTTPTDTGVGSYTATGLSVGTTYYFKVSAVNSAGESSQSSSVSATTLRIGTPTSVSATATSSSSITVSWSAVSGEYYYYVYYSTSASGTYTRVTGTFTTTSAIVSGLSPNTTYYFKVSVYNSTGGEGPQSSYASARTNSQ